MINNTYLHPIRTSDYSKSVPSCHISTSHPPSTNTSPYSILKLPLLSSRFSIPYPSVIKIFKIPSPGDKEIGEKAHVKIRVPYSLMVKLSSSTKRPR